MQPKHILFLAVSTVLLVFLVTVGWEFSLEDIIRQSGTGDGAEESTQERWEYVATATFAAGIAVGVLGLVSLRIITQLNRTERMLQEAHQTLEQRVVERTAELEEEIASRKRTEETLQASEVRLAGILDIAPDAVIMVDQDQCIRLFNQRAEAIFGYTADEVLKRPLDMLLPAHLRDVHGKHVERFACSAKPTLIMGGRMEIVGLRKDGSQFPADASVSKQQQSGIALFTVMLRDVTERKRTEEALLASELSLKERVVDLEYANDSIENQGAKLVELAEDLAVARDQANASSRAKSEFLASMSHELRTPLNAIIGFSEIMNTETLGPIGSPKYRDYAGDIHDSGQHLLDLINDILDLSKIESGNEELYEENVAVIDLTKSALRLVVQRAEQHGVRVELKQPDDLPALYADARKLKQILVNLLSNAVKFTKTGGTVTLKTWCNADSGHVFQVIDTGIGIARENIPKALSQFGQIYSSVSREHVGTGLGLPLTKSLVELHGGSLDLQSEIVVGTTVTVRFPAERIVDLPTKKAPSSAA